MSHDDRIDEARLTVLMDVRQPFAYLALGPTIELGRRQGLEVNWLPASVSPLRPPPPESEGNERSVAHRRNRSRMIAREIAIIIVLARLLESRARRRVVVVVIVSGSFLRVPIVIHLALARGRARSSPDDRPVTPTRGSRSFRRLDPTIESSRVSRLATIRSMG